MPDEVAYDESDPKLAIPRLREIVRRLRAPDGCPWDIEQTHESLIPNLLEEAYEAADAIRSGDRAHMREELGVFPHNVSSCSPLIDGDLLYTATSNGVDWSHTNIPAPLAPSLVALDKNTGELVGEDITGVSERVLHASWSSRYW